MRHFRSIQGFNGNELSYKAMVPHGQAGSDKGVAAHSVNDSGRSVVQRP